MSLPHKEFKLICNIVAACLCFCLTSCGLEQVAAVGSGGTSKIGGTVATGSAAVGAIVTIQDATGKTVSAPVTTDTEGAFVFNISTDSVTPPFLLRAKINNTTNYHALLRSAESTNVVNIHQISELVTALSLSKDPQTVTVQERLDASSLAKTHPKAISDVGEILKPIMTVKASVIGGSFTNLAAALSQPMQTNNLGVDGLLDAISVSKETTLNALPSYTIAVNGEASAIAPIQLKPTSSSVASAIAQASSSSYVAQVNASTVLKSVPVTVFYDGQTNKTGALAVWLPVPASGGWVLTFDTNSFAATSFGGVIAQQVAITAPDARPLNQMTLSSLTSQLQSANTVVGVSLAPINERAVDIRNCRFNGNPCAVRLAQRNEIGTHSFKALLDVYGQSALFSGVMNQVESALANPPTRGGPPTSTGSVNSNNDLEVTLELLTEWVGGYGAQFSIKNISGKDLSANTNWSANVTMPEGTIDGGPWSLDAVYANGVYTLTPKSWVKAQTFINQTTVSSGFNGAGCINSLVLVPSSNTQLVIGPKLRERLNAATPCATSP